MSEDKKRKVKQFTYEKIDREINPLSQKIGVFVIAAMTLLGASLIVYSGARAAFHTDPDEGVELLVVEEVVDVEDLPALDEDVETDVDVDEVDDVEEDADLDEDVADADEVLNEEADDDADDEDEVVEEDVEDDEADEPADDISLPFQGQINVVTAFLREEPNTTSMRLELLGERDVFTVTRIEGDWARVNFNGTIGYVFLELIEEVE